MPRYFFDVYCNSRAEGDRVAIEFPSPQAAIEDAKQALLELMRDEALDCRIEILDPEGSVVARVPDHWLH
jgi:Domain of unknown function (DUF6894)